MSCPTEEVARFYRALDKAMTDSGCRQRHWCGTFSGFEENLFLIKALNRFKLQIGYLQFIDSSVITVPKKLYV
jgi:hypothetical protein